MRRLTLTSLLVATALALGIPSIASAINTVDVFWTASSSSDPEAVACIMAGSCTDIKAAPGDALTLEYRGSSCIETIFIRRQVVDDRYQCCPR